jgi:hypothetical protein
MTQDMSEEKKDIKIPADVVGESATGLAQKEDLAVEIDYNFHGKDFGYARTLDELETALDEADSERNDPTKWITPVEFHTRLEDKFPWLR